LAPQAASVASSDAPPRAGLSPDAIDAASARIDAATALIKGG
jgi:hypothetical protein